MKEATKLEAAKKATTNGTTFATTPVTSANASPITGRAGGGRNPTETSVPDGNSIIEPPDTSLPNPPSNAKSENHAEGDKNNHARSQSLSGLQVSHFSKPIKTIFKRFKINFLMVFFSLEKVQNIKLRLKNHRRL